MSPPPSVRTTTMGPTPWKSTCSGETSWTSIGALPLQRLRLGEHRLDPADIEECLLGNMVELAADERLEALHGLFDRHEDPLQTSEDLAHEERLAQVLLHLAGPGDGDLVLLGELVEAEDGDDVLQLLV